MENKKKRIEYLDIAKGLAIIGVVLCHSMTNNDYIFDIIHPTLHNWFCFFCVSTFFMINGMLYSEKAVEHPFMSILKRLKSYYIPYLGFNLAFYIFHNLWVDVHFLSDNKFGPKEFVIGLIRLLLGEMQPLTGPMWFMRALIVISIIYILIDSVSYRAFGGKYRYLINGIVVGALINLPGTFNFDDGCRSLFIYMFGVIFRKYDLNRYIKKYNIAFFASLLVITVIMSNIFYVGLLPSINYPIYVLSQILGVTMAISGAQIPVIEKSKVLKLLGNSSLDIMALHFFSFKFISLLIIGIYGLDIKFLEDIPIIKTEINDFCVIAYLLIGLLLPTCFSLVRLRVLEKIKDSKK